MGMSTHVAGFIPPDQVWENNKAVWNACEKAGILVPKEVDKFFNWENPNKTLGREANIEEAKTVFSDESREGFDIDLSKLPKEVKFIRFYNSY